MASSSGRSTPHGREIRCPRETNQKESGVNDISRRRPYRSRNLSFYSTPPAPARVTPTCREIMNLSLSTTSSGRSTPSQSEVNPRKNALTDSNGLMDISGSNGLMNLSRSNGLMDLSESTSTSGRSTPHSMEITCTGETSQEESGMNDMSRTSPNLHTKWTSTSKSTPPRSVINPREFFASAFSSGSENEIESDVDTGIDIDPRGSALSGPTYELRDCNFCNCGVTFMVPKEESVPTKSSPAKPASKPPAAMRPSLLEVLEELDGHFANSYSKF